MIGELAPGQPRLRASWARWNIVALLMAMSFMSHFNRQSMSVAGNSIMRTPELHISDNEMGAIYSALLLSYTAFMVPAGWFCDRRGGRLALAVMGIGSGLCGLLTGIVGILALSGAALFVSLLAIRALTGASMAPIYPAAGRIVSHWVPFHQRALTNALVTGSAPMGVASAFVLFGALDDGLGWERAFLVTGSITIGLSVLWAWYGRNDPSANAIQKPSVQHEPGAGSAPYAWTALLRNRSLWLLTISYGCVNYVEYLLFYWSEHYFNSVLHFSVDDSRLASMILTITMGVCLPLGGWLSDRLLTRFGYRGSRALVAVAGMAACGLLLALGTMLGSGLMIVACLALALGGAGIAEGPSWATAIDLGGARGGSSAAIVNTGGNGVGLLAPAVTPLVSAWLTSSLGAEAAWAWGMRLGSMICLFGACLWIWIDAGERCHDLPISAKS
jgi:sugar phosphate permease